MHTVSARELALVQRSAEALRARVEDCLPFFLERFYALAPSARALLPTPDAERRKFNAMLATLGSGRRFDDWEFMAERMGRRHGGYGAEAAQLLPLGSAFLATVERFDATADAHTLAAWEAVLGEHARVMAHAMRRAAAEAAARAASEETLAAGQGGVSGAGSAPDSAGREGAGVSVAATRTEGPGSGVGAAASVAAGSAGGATTGRPDAHGTVVADRGAAVVGVVAGDRPHEGNGAVAGLAPRAGGAVSAASFASAASASAPASASAAAAGPAAAPAVPLIDLVGGEAVVSAVHRRFYEQLFDDPWIGVFFYGKSIDSLVLKQTKFMVAAFGGPNEYRWEAPDIAHTHMYVTDEQADIRETVLRNAIRAQGLAQEVEDRWLATDQSFRPAIVKQSVDECHVRVPGQVPVVARKPAGYRAPSLVPRD